MFSIKNDVALLHECGYSKTDSLRLCLEYKMVLLEQNEE